MKIASKKSRIIALVLVVMLLLSTFAGCVPGNENSESNDNTGDNSGNNSNDNTSDDNQSDDNTGSGNNDGTHTCVFGNWEVIKEPTTDTDGLQERKCECGNVEKKVIPASGKEYVILYRNLNNAEYPSPNGYNSTDGLLELPHPEADGYKFIGWYTASIGGDLVDYIPKGSTGDFILYAHWELVTYDITYKNVPNNTNPTSYNIESKIKLETPKWSGLVFTHWSDEEGNVYTPSINITALPEKMTGDLILTANWKVLRNIATPAADNATMYSDFSSEDGYLFFYYHLGTIQHVVLDSNDELTNNLYYKYEGVPINYSLSQTVSIGKETANSISNTISESISQSIATESSMNFAKTSGTNWNSEIGSSIGTETSAEVDAGVAKASTSVTATIEAKLGVGGSSGTSEGWGSSVSTQNETTSENSKTVSSSLAYMEEISTTKEESISVSADQPSGYYAYVHAGNIEVHAVVIYDIETGYLYMNTYSYLNNMHTMVMYYPDVASLSTPAVDSLDFTIPEEEIVNMIESSYYVKYDANGGQGTMPTTMHSIDGTEQLANNEFTKEGCIFAGWKLETDDGVQILLDGQSVTNLAKPLQTITLKAIWEGDPTYDKDVVYTLTTKSGTVSQYTAGVRPGINYTAKIEYRNRTADSIEIKITWTTTRTNGWTSYGQNVKLSIGSVTSGTINLVSFNGWGQNSSNKTSTKDTGWMTVSLNTRDATTIGLKVQYWQTNSNGVDMSNNSYDPTKAINTTWTIDIPAAKY